MEKTHEPKNGKKAFHIFVYGKVQGVGFRCWTVSIANRLGVKGFVRNLPDYSVEIVAEAGNAVLNDFLSCLKNGHPYAKVERITVSEIPIQNFDRFKTEY